MIEAAYRLVTSLGIQNLTFRAVAAEAGVPLGSVSYYFSNRNVMVIEVLAFARARVLKHYQRVERKVKAGKTWIEALAEHVAWVTTTDQVNLVRDYEMFLYGLDHPDLAEMSRSWTASSNEVLIRVVPRDLLEPVSFMLEGMFLTAAKTGRRFSAEEVHRHLQRMVGDGS